MVNAHLSLLNIHKWYVQGDTKIPVLQGVYAHFMQGATYALTGVSGTGKSTCMHILASVEAPDSGIVLFGKTNINAVAVAQRARLLSTHVGLLFQRPYLISELSVIENIIVPGLIAGKDKEECLHEARDILAVLGLESKKNSKPGMLSGGQQQRVALARALFNKPAFLLADEPTGSLDAKTGQELVGFLLSCREQWGMGIVVSTHDKYLTDAMESVHEIKNGVLHTVREPMQVLSPAHNQSTPGPI